MATRFAIGNGNWSNTAIWDGGALPLSNDDIFANNFTVTLDQDITVGSLRNTAGDVYLPGMPIPKMTGNTQPNGEVFAGQNTSTAFQAFDYNTSTRWNAFSFTNCFIGYKFTIGKIIKRYYFNKYNGTQAATAWTFQGSNDGITYDILETVTSNSSITYLSGILANTTSYIYYRINVTANVNGDGAVFIQSLEMTENVGTVYGGTTGGKYVVPNTLSGSRNIVQTGDGIISNNAATVVETNNTSGNTVNFNISGSGLILNQFSQTANAGIYIINILGVGAVNFNSNIYGSQSTANINNTSGTIGINANSIVTINGNVYLAKGHQGSSHNTINLVGGTSNSAILNINGNVIGSNLYAYSYIYLGSSATINITGNLISDTSSCIVTAIGAFSGGAGFINLVGTATLNSSSSQPCIISRSTLVTITGNVTNKNNTMAISAGKIRWQNVGVPYWIFQDTTGANIALSNGTITGSYPNEADVRLGVTYATGPVRTGTCNVPLPQYVSQGVPVGSSVGTGYLNPAEVWNILTSTISTTNSIGVRLKVASTIETTGDQLAAF